jgi:hypothetical protein
MIIRIRLQKVEGGYILSENILAEKSFLKKNKKRIIDEKVCRQGYES